MAVLASRFIDIREQFPSVDPSQGSRALRKGPPCSLRVIILPGISDDLRQGREPVGMAVELEYHRLSGLLSGIENPAEFAVHVDSYMSCCHRAHLPSKNS